jgi:hypothetical protein
MVMNCGVCGKDIGKVIMNLPLKKADGSLSTLVCLKCAQKSSLFCKKHQKPHIGFSDGTTACIYCIEEMVAKNQKKRDIISNELREKLPQEELERLMNWATKSSSKNGSNVNTCILRLIATKAKRNSQSIEEVLKNTIEAKSVKCLLPSQPISSKQSQH